MMIEFKQVSKQYHKKDYFLEKTDLFWALQNVSFSISKGETVGLIGPTGAGKTTVMKLISEITYPTQGKILINGSVIPLISIGGCLDSLLTGRENVDLLLAIFGCPGVKKNERLKEILEFSNLGDFMDMPLRKYSSGMWSRLAFSIAVNMPSDIILIDEVLSVGDQDFQERCFKKIEEFKKEQKTIIFVSHNTEDLRRVCNRVIWLNRGTIAQDDLTEKVLKKYLEHDPAAIHKNNID